MNAISICDTAIRLNDGLYSLNDLHQAAGGDEKYQPSFFLRNDQTKALIAEISNSAFLQNYAAVKTTRGKTGGTYVCRELVYAYAMWISAKFSLEVIRAFDAQHAQPVLDAPAPPQLNGESEDEQRTKLALAALHGGRFMTYFGDNGVTVMMPVKRTAFVVEPEEIAGILKEPGSVPLRLLPEIIMACATRLANASPSAPKPTGVAV